MWNVVYNLLLNNLINANVYLIIYLYRNVSLFYLIYQFFFSLSLKILYYLLLFSKKKKEELRRNSWSSCFKLNTYILFYANLVIFIKIFGLGEYLMKHEFFIKSGNKTRSLYVRHEIGKTLRLLFICVKMLIRKKYK